MNQTDVENIYKLDAMVRKITDSLAKHGYADAEDNNDTGNTGDAGNANTADDIPLARIRALNESNDDDDVDDLPLATRVLSTRARPKRTTRRRSRSRNATKRVRLAREQDLDDVPLIERVSKSRRSRSRSKPRKDGKALDGIDYANGTLRLIGNRATVNHLTNQVIFSRVRRFVGLAVKQIRGGKADAVIVGDEAARTLLTLAIDHMYHMLRSFIILYVSMRYVDPRRHPSIIIQGSFLPDFLQTLDGVYNDANARTICPRTNAPANRSLSRGERGLITSRSDRDTSQMSSLALKSPKPDRKSASGVSMADRSCVFVTERTHLLSRRFFAALTEILAQDIWSEAGEIKMKIRASSEFGSEVNQAVVYVLYRATNDAIAMAEYRARGDVFRVTERDVQSAFDRLLPSNVPCPASK